MLTQLTADGWTVRDGEGNYGLGLGLLTVARRAEAAFPLRRLALTPLREFAAAKTYVAKALTGSYESL